MTGYVEQPREPLRPVVETAAAFEDCVAALARGTGPIAIDTERAHGYRYWPKAYLLQLRREGTGTWLLDPVALTTGEGPADLSALTAAAGDATWVIHAATQDLPSLLEVGVRPGRIFDTELGARLLGEPAVSLGALLEEKLGVRLRKQHSAQNWSKRPLPHDWLVYAALDVDYLLELAADVEEELRRGGRLEWAREEFDAALSAALAPADRRPEPWRRVSGLQVLRTPRQLAVVRALWQERDRLARERDRPPGHVLGDDVIVQIAALVPPDGPLPSRSEVEAVPGFSRRSTQRYRNNWLQAVARVGQLQPSQYPRRRPESTRPPAPSTWGRTNPGAAALWARVRPAVDELACELSVAPSLIVTTTLLQEVVLEQAEDGDFAGALLRRGVRPWQRDFLEPLLRDAHRAT